MAAKKRAIDTSGIDRIVGYRLRRAQMAVFARFARRFEAAGIKPAEYSALILAADNPGLRPSDMAAVLGIQRANFVALAAGLEARGLIERTTAETDRRSHVIHLTEAGATMVTDIRRTQDKFEAELIAALGGEAERDRLVTLLARLG